MYYYTSAHGLSYGGAAPERASLPGPMHRRHCATPPVGQCAHGAGPRSHRPGSRALYFAIFCGSARAQGARAAGLLPDWQSTVAL